MEILTLEDVVQDRLQSIPYVRSHRRVGGVEMLAEGVSIETILADFPDLEREDIAAALRFAARRIDIPRLAA